MSISVHGHHNRFIAGRAWRRWLIVVVLLLVWALLSGAMTTQSKEEKPAPSDEERFVWSYLKEVMLRRQLAGAQETLEQVKIEAYARDPRLYRFAQELQQFEERDWDEGELLRQRVQAYKATLDLRGKNTLDYHQYEIKMAWKKVNMKQFYNSRDYREVFELVWFMPGMSELQLYVREDIQREVPDLEDEYDLKDPVQLLEAMYRYLDLGEPIWRKKAARLEAEYKQPACVVDLARYEARTNRRAYKDFIRFLTPDEVGKAQGHVNGLQTKLNRRHAANLELLKKLRQDRADAKSANAFPGTSSTPTNVESMVADLPPGAAVSESPAARVDSSGSVSNPARHDETAEPDEEMPDATPIHTRFLIGLFLLVVVILAAKTLKGRGP